MTPYNLGAAALFTLIFSLYTIAAWWYAIDGGFFSDGKPKDELNKYQRSFMIVLSLLTIVSWAWLLNAYYLWR